MALKCTHSLCPGALGLHAFSCFCGWGGLLAVGGATVLRLMRAALYPPPPLSTQLRTFPAGEQQKKKAVAMRKPKAKSKQSTTHNAKSPSHAHNMLTYKLWLGCVVAVWRVYRRWRRICFLALSAFLFPVLYRQIALVLWYT